MKEMIPVEREKLKELLAHMMRKANCKNDTVYIEKFLTILNPIPTLTKENWQRVIDEKFYVRYVVGGAAIFLIDDKRDTDEVEVIREKGLRQPHFQGHPHPEGDISLVVYHWSGGYTSNVFARSITDWDNVREYICL